MRAHSPAERLALGFARVTHQVRVEVKDADGVWRDWTGWVTALSWGEGRDQPVSAASFSLFRGKGTGSLSPFMAMSTLNRDSINAYAPAVDIGRAVRISTNAGPDGWRAQWEGRVDTLDAGQDVVPVTCSDLGAWLMDTQMEATFSYGSDVGVPLETVIQQLLDAYPSGMGVPSLYTPVLPDYFLHAATIEPVKVMEAIRTLAGNIGWDVRYRYDAAHGYRLTLTDPDRDRVTTDGTIGPGEYSVIPRIALSIDPVRNAGRWYYGPGDADYASFEDAPSIARYGRRWFQIPPQGGIDTLAEAERAIAAAGNDMSGPGVEFALTTFYLWPVQLFDRWTFEADAKGFDTNQIVSVASYRHEWVGGTIVTTITGTARVVGAYREWRKRMQGEMPPAPITESEIYNVRVTNISPTVARVSWIRGGGVDYVFAFTQTDVAEAPFPPPSLADARILGSGIDYIDVPVPPPGYRTFVQLEARGGGNFGILSDPVRLHVEGQVSSAWIGDGAVTTPKVGDGAVTTPKIADGAIFTQKMALEAITSAILAAGAVTTTKITDGAIETPKLAAGAVTTPKITAGAVTAIQMNVGTLDEITDDAGIIVSGKLQNAAGTRYLDLDATGTAPFLLHDKLSLNADGTAEFSGQIGAGSVAAGMIEMATSAFLRWWPGSLPGTMTLLRAVYGFGSASIMELRTNGTDVELLTGGSTPGVRFAASQPGLAGETSISIQFDNGSSVVTRRVMAGAPDSGGTGYRTLLVAN